MTYTALDNTWAEPTRNTAITITAASSDLRFDSTGACFQRGVGGQCTVYASLAARTVPVLSADNDFEAFAVSTDAINNPNVEGVEGRAGWSYVLTTRFQPVSSVVFTATYSDYLTVSPSVITVDHSNYMQDIPFTVTIVNDNVERNAAAFTTAVTWSGDASYTGTADTFVVGITDDDAVGVRSNATFFSENAGSWSATYGLTLTSQPMAPVTVAVAVAVVMHIAIAAVHAVNTCKRRHRHPVSPPGTYCFRIAVTKWCHRGGRG